MEKAVVWFSEGTKEQKALLGGKGANLAEMTNLGLPVPQGFIVPATICLTYLEEQVLPEAIIKQASQSCHRRIGSPQEQNIWRTAVAVIGFCPQWCQVFHARDDGYDLKPWVE